jgi:hypothetical protein
VNDFDHFEVRSRSGPRNPRAYFFQTKNQTKKLGLWIFSVNLRAMTTLGYARVSTEGQSLPSQTEALHAVYSKKMSGAYSERP